MDRTQWGERQRQSRERPSFVSRYFPLTRRFFFLLVEVRSSQRQLGYSTLRGVIISREQFLEFLKLEESSPNPSV